MAEQDRLGGWFGGNKADKVQDKARESMPRASGAEQDRYGGYFGGDKADQARDAIPRPRGSGAEQDRYGGYFGGDKLPSRAEINERLPQTSGAEQDRYERWFGGDKAGRVNASLPRSSGAEQDRYGSHFRQGTGGGIGSGTASTLGLFQHAVAPSLGFHGALGLAAYGAGRWADRVDAKDVLWPAGPVANAWWSALGIPVLYEGASPAAAWRALSYDQRLLLAGVSAWGARLLYRVASRGARRGADDRRYRTAARKDAKTFWNKALFGLFVPEALAQTVISLPFTLPFRAPVASALASPETPAASSPIAHGIAVFLFAAGFALETLADVQLESHARSAKRGELKRDGVWSIVRHPNYLGDALCHLSFPILLYAAGQLHPLAVLGPVANYAFLRYVGGDRENEADQERRYAAEQPAKHRQLLRYRADKNSFWPGIAEAGNKWLWAVAAVGAGGVVLERSVFSFLRS
ncbi:DUF1295-domain-containing protein [Hypoxylon sp. FL1284]|nr:DUF1295-domain-containing protein [Hypoxylon sp. FL1284]